MLFRRSTAPAEAQRLLSEFEATAGTADFPCVFAPKAFARDELLFGVATYAPDDPSELLGVFDDLVAAVDDNPDQAIVIWIRTARPPQTLTDDRLLAAEIVRDLIRGAGDWPASETTDPSDPSWNLWYRGVDLFLNFSTPHHCSRRSRNLGSTFTIVAQARASFDRLPGAGAAARGIIRQRLSQYDAIHPSPMLGTHGDSPELPQYFLGDANECPFHPVTKDDVDTLLNYRITAARHA